MWFAFVAEVPRVIVNVMRGGPSTGLVYSPRLLRTKAGCGSGRSIRSPSFDENADVEGTPFLPS